MILDFIYVIVGEKSFTWLGPNPVVYITDPDHIKDVLNDFYLYQKSQRTNPIIKLLANGLVHYEGDKWVKHRKLINPAFHLEKLKV